MVKALILLVLLVPSIAQSATAETTLTVVITEEISSSQHTGVYAAVACNEINCPDATTIESVEIQSWWQRFLTWLGF